MVKVWRVGGVILGVSVLGLFSPVGAEVGGTVDCIADKGNLVGGWIDDGEDLVLTTVNCDLIYRRSRTGESSGPFPLSPGEVITISSGESADVRNRAEAYGAFAESWPVFPATRPTGSFLGTAVLTAGEAPSEFTLGPGVDDIVELGGRPECALDAYGPTSVYTSIDIEIFTRGTYTFRNTTTDPLGNYEVLGARHPLEDPLLAIYSTFDPADPDEGLIACQDDLSSLFGYDVLDNYIAERLSDGTFMEGHRPYLTVDLAPGKYTLMYTVHEAISAEDWMTGGDGWFTPGPASGTIEMWGPADSICLSDDTACVEEQANAANPSTTVPVEIPSTGSSSGTPLWVALMAVLVGGGLVVASRRSVRRA